MSVGTVEILGTFRLKLLRINMAAIDQMRRSTFRISMTGTPILSSRICGGTPVGV